MRPRGVARPRNRDPTSLQRLVARVDAMFNDPSIENEIARERQRDLIARAERFRQGQAATAQPETTRRFSGLRRLILRGNLRWRASRVSA
jgi:hypothetical protein